MPSVNGRQLLEPIKVIYTGSDTLKNGYLLAYDHDGSTAAIRESNVEKPTYANLLAGAFAGRVVNAPSGGYVATGTGETPIMIRPVLPEGFDDRNADVFTDENVAVGDILGPIPGSYYAGRAVFPECAVFRASEAQDRSGTAGLVNGKFGRMNQSSPAIADKISRHFDHFRSANVDKVVANIATGTAGHYLLNGTTAVAFQNTAGSTPAATGVGELTVVGTTTTIGQIQQAGGQYLLSAGRSIFVRMRVKIDDISDEDWIMGLGTPPTVSAGVLTAVAQVTSGGTAPAGTDYIGFFFDATGGTNTNININIRKASGTQETNSLGVAFVNNTYIELAFLARNRVSGSTAAGAKTVQSFVNGVLIDTMNTATEAAAFPDTIALAFALSGITGGCVGTIDLLDIIASH